VYACILHPCGGRLSARRVSSRASFVGVHVAIGLGDEGVWRGPVVGIHGHAHADAQRHAVYLTRARRLRETLDQGIGARAAGFRHDDREFVAPDPRDQVDSPRLLAQDGSDRADEHVAPHVPPRVVHALESIDVDEDQAHCVPEARGALDLVVQTRVEGAPVGNAREAVGQRLRGEQGQSGVLIAGHGGGGEIAQDTADLEKRDKPGVVRVGEVADDGVHGVGMGVVGAGDDGGQRNTPAVREGAEFGGEGLDRGQDIAGQGVRQRGQQRPLKGL